MTNEAENESRHLREREQAAYTKARATLLSAIANYIPSKYSAARLSDFPKNLRTELDWAKIDGVFLPGDVGIGKTHLATALAINYIRPNGYLLTASSYPAFYDRLIRWISAPMLLTRIRGTFRDNAKESEHDVIEEMASCRVLVLDDLGAEKITDFSAATLYAIISDRINRRHMTIVTSNQLINDIKEWEPRIASRLNAFLRIDLPDIDRRIKPGNQ